MSEKQFKIGDKVIVIGKYEADNFWIGIITNINGRSASLDIGTNVDIDDLELYDKSTNWMEFYKTKYPHPEFWDGD